MSNLLAARAQMGTSLAFHIIFASLSIGLPMLLCIAEGLALWRQDSGWMTLTRRWTKAFTLLFAIGAVSGTILSFEIGLLWHGLLDHALPLAIATALLGVGAALSFFLRRYRLARVLAFTVTAFIFASWDVSQFPYLVPVAVTITNAASPPSTLLALLIGTLIGMALLLPSLWLLFHVFKGKHPALNISEQGTEVAQK